MALRHYCIRVPNEYSLRPFDGAATVKNGRVSRLSGVIPASGAPFAITVAILRWGVAWGVCVIDPRSSFL